MVDDIKIDLWAGVHGLPLGTSLFLLMVVLPHRAMQLFWGTCCGDEMSFGSPGTQVQSCELLGDRGKGAIGLPRTVPKSPGLPIGGKSFSNSSRSSL